MVKKEKKNKPLVKNMGFDEMLERLSRVDKSTVEKNIERKKKK